MTPRDFVIWLRGFQKAAHKFNLTPEQWEDLKDQLELVKLEDEPVNSHSPSGLILRGGSTTARDSSVCTTITTGGHTTVTQMPPGTNITYTNKQQLND